ncbi:hypothetical protein I7I48_03477 [Histoplasma ohiense]|nr:hypothetical protein I7I48_03477 [Histoplasma ohiense (nom. inval.)]
MSPNPSLSASEEGTGARQTGGTVIANVKEISVYILNSEHCFLVRV